MTSSGTISTQGRFAPAFVGQTIGGGGGFAAVTAASGINTAGVSFALGSTGGSGGSADPSGASSFTIGAGAIRTYGKVSAGVVTQSIGGGGGLAGFVSDGGVTPLFTGAALGASGGGSFSAGSKFATSVASSVITGGVGSVGVIAQSIGGGGGVGEAFGISGAGPIVLGATNGAGGNGGEVDLTVSGQVATSGVNTHGVIAQSIGGGGGLFLAFDGAGNPLTTNVIAGAGGGGGAGGVVNVALKAGGDVYTTGAGAHGLIAQSIAGGGGIVGGGQFATTLPTNGPFAGSAGGSGSAGAVFANVQSNIIVTGRDSSAIVAKSADHTGRGGPITVQTGDTAPGTANFIYGGDGLGNAVTLLGGSANTLTNFDTMTTKSGIAGMAITGGLGDDAVFNYGHLIGSINLGPGPTL